MRLESAEEVLYGHAAVHDRTQFEVTFTYDVSAGNIGFGKDYERYRIEAFFFCPTNMGITAMSFPRETFYRALRGYVRYKTPEMEPALLLDPLNRQSPLNVLTFHLKQLAAGNGQGAPAIAQGETEARLFGCITNSLLKFHAQEARYLLEHAQARASDAARWQGLESFVADSLATLEVLLARYRAIVREYQLYAQRLTPAFLSHLGHVDEFLTYRFDDVLAALHFELSGAWEAPETIDRLTALLREAARREHAYRIVQGYITLSPGDEQALALYTYRSGALKKLVEQVLYLEVQTVQETNRWRNLAAMAGALLAALFAGLSDRNVVFKLWGPNFWLAIALFAIAYVIKDRMKELLREALWTRVARYFPDNRLLVHDPVNEHDIGHWKERLRYMPKAGVPADVLRVRNVNHAIDLDEERDETVIGYTNDVTLYAKSILAEHQRRNDIKHILRFAVEDLLPRLDNPTARVQFYDASSELFCRLRAPKVYHMNVVFRFTRWDDKNRAEQPHYQRIRVVLDKNGIQRIDAVVDACGQHDLDSWRAPAGTGPLRQVPADPA